LSQIRACRVDSKETSSCRFFLCARCRCHVLLCSRCDRGQIYCGRDCASEARRCKQREARARYQATVRGRELHAERNRQYRARRRCVTDQGSLSQVKVAQPVAPNRDAFPPASTGGNNAPISKHACRCCGSQTSKFVRLSTMRRPRRASSGRFRGPF
jgi:hypothetical protein